jgi:hypothetical protein
MAASLAGLGLAQFGDDVGIEQLHRALAQVCGACELASARRIETHSLGARHGQ